MAWVAGCCSETDANDKSNRGGRSSRRCKALLDRGGETTIRDERAMCGSTARASGVVSEASVSCGGTRSPLERSRLLPGIGDTGWPKDPRTGMMRMWRHDNCGRRRSDDFASGRPHRRPAAARALQIVGGADWYIAEKGRFDFVGRGDISEADMRAVHQSCPTPSLSVYGARKPSMTSFRPTRCSRGESRGRRGRPARCIRNCSGSPKGRASPSCPASGCAGWTVSVSTNPARWCPCRGRTRRSI